MTGNKIAFVEGTSKTFRSGDTEITALHPTNLELRKGELLLIIGPSGSGKTTLLSLLGCVIYPSSGRVVISSRETTHLSDAEMAHLRLNQIGFIFQNFNLVAPLTAEANVGLPLKLQGVAWAEAEARVAQALDKVNMMHRRKSMPRQLSGGEQQRIAIARALVTNPGLMLCDEPTASLDPRSVDTVMHELRTLAEQGKALAVVTHDMRLRSFAHRIVEVNDGRAQEVSPGGGNEWH